VNFIANHPVQEERPQIYTDFHGLIYGGYQISTA
jgi:hypothetical protein